MSIQTEPSPLTAPTVAAPSQPPPPPQAASPAPLPTRRLSRSSRRKRKLCARTSNKRLGLLLRVYCLQRSVFFDNEVLPNLKAEVLVLGLGLVGMVGFFGWRAMEQAEQNAELRMRHQFARHEKREEAMARFADGIPKNLSYLTSISRHALSWGRHRAEARPAEEARHILQAHTAELAEWRKSCPHYSSLCEEIIGRFGGESGADAAVSSGVAPEVLHARRQCLRKTVQAIGQLLGTLNTLRLDDHVESSRHVNQSVADVRASLESWRRAFEQSNGPRHATPLASSAIAAPPPTRSAGAAGAAATTASGDSTTLPAVAPPVERAPIEEILVEGRPIHDLLSSLEALEIDDPGAEASPELRYRAARAVADGIIPLVDDLQILALRLMHLELAELPRLP